MAAARKDKKQSPKLSKRSARVVGGLAVMLAFRLAKASAKQRKVINLKFRKLLSTVIELCEQTEIKDESQLEIIGQIASETVNMMFYTTPTITGGFCSGARGTSRPECVRNGGTWNGMPPYICDFFDNPVFPQEIEKPNYGK